MSNKDSILEAALILFNEKGTATVSTNHIAAAAAVSPGNLYYHFHHKNDIILALVREMYRRWASELSLPLDRPPGPGDLEALLKSTFRLIGAYRFFYRDMVSLLRADLTLRDEYLSQRRRGMNDFRDMVAAFAGIGVFSGSLKPADLRRTADLCWMVTEFWLQNLEIEGLKPDEAQMKRGIALVKHVLKKELG
jgi:AcrR family transcriptional regulator